MKRMMLPLAAGLMLIGGTAAAQDTTSRDTSRTQPRMDMGQKKGGDHKVIKAAIAANEAEVAVADLALSKTQNEQVREYATKLRRDHSAMLEKLREHGRAGGEGVGQAGQMGQGVGLGDDPELREMKRNSEDKLRALTQLDTTAFDSLYIEHMVAAHQNMLTTIDMKWLPNVQDAALRSTLEGAKPTVQEHLREAEALKHRKHGMPEPTMSRDTTTRVP